MSPFWRGTHAMIHRIRAHMTYANVMATIAVFIALQIILNRTPLGLQMRAWR